MAARPSAFRSPAPTDEPAVDVPAASPVRRRALLAAALTSAGLAACGRGRERGAAAPSLPAAGSVRPAATGVPGALTWAAHQGDLDAAGREVRTALAGFTRRTGVAVRCLEEVRSDRTYAALLETLRRRGQPFARDLVVLGDAETTHLVRGGALARLDGGAVPNAVNLQPVLTDVDVDPGRRSSLPWRGAYTGLVWNRAAVADPLVDVADLWRPALRGRVVVPPDWRDALGLLALGAGARVDGPLPAEALDAALGQLERQLAARHLLGAQDPIAALRSGRAWAGIARSTDVQRLQAGAPGRFSFVVPDSGALLVSNDLVVPAGGPRVDDALRLVDHLYDPAVAALVSRTVPGLCPVVGAREHLARVDPMRAASPLVFPTDADLARSQVFAAPSREQEDRYAQAYQVTVGVPR